MGDFRLVGGYFGGMKEMGQGELGSCYKLQVGPNVYWTVHHCNSWRMKDQLDVTCYILFHFLCAQHVSDMNISIIRSLRLCWWITTSVVLFCKDGWFSVSVNLRCIQITKHINKALITKQPMKNTRHKRTQWSQSIRDSGQNQLKYTYQLQQSDKTHHTKYTPLYTIKLH